MRRCGAALSGLVLAASVLAVLPAGRADAQTAHTFVANTGQADGGSAALGNDYAQAFTTGSNSAGYSLRSVDAEFSAVDSGFSPSALTASIHTDSGGSPGSSLGTLTSPASFPVSASDQTLTFTSAGIDLEASTTYFLVIDMGSAHAVSGLRSTASDSEDSGASAGWSIGDSVLTRGFSSTGSWTTNAPSLKVSLGGVATETEPPNFVGNLGQGDGGSSFLGNDFAQAFTTGDYSFGYYLLSVRVQFSNIASGFDASALTASIHADSGGSPGSSLGELVSPESFPESASDQTLTFTSAGIDLEASTTYFLVIDMGTGQGSSRISLTASDSEDSGGSAGWSIGDGALTRTASSTGAWTPNTSSLVVGLDGVDRTPRVGITGGGAVTEGASASFTLTASPAPAAGLPVDVSVTTSGDFGFGALPTRVTIPTSGTATLTVATTGDDVDESDGSVTVSLVEGRDYDLATALETATVAVRDDDPPLVANTGKAQSAFDSLAFDHAQAFTTGGNPPGYILTGVDVVFHQISDSAIGSKLAVTVNRDNGGVPGATVATLTNPGTIADGTNGFTHSGVSLAADTKYWVVVDGSSSISGANFVSVTASNAEDAGAAIGWSIADESYQNSSGSWQVLGQSGKLRIGVSGRLLPNSDGSFTVPFDWPLKPPGVGGGDAFRLMFMTEDHRDATSADIDVYDAHVREAAREGHAAIRRYADKFRVVGSTSEVDARDHTRTNRNNAAHTDVPIWWLNGQRIAPGNAVFWSDTWENWAMADRRFASGETSTSNDWPWTGTRTDGAKEANPLGASNARRGRFSTTSSDTGPISYNTVASTQDHAFYGMSPVFRVASTVNAPPGEPAVLSNLGQADGAAVNLTAQANTTDVAQSFTTGNNGDHYRLNSVDVEFAQISDSRVGSNLRVQVWADNGGTPNRNRVLANLARPNMPVGSTDRTYAFTYQGDGAGLLLAPNTTYWVVAFDNSESLLGSNSIRATASSSERLQGLRLPEGWSIGDDSLRRPVTTSSWSTNSEALKIGLNLGAADHFVQFRTCEGVVSGNDCSTGWVIANYTRHDPPPTITLVEGGPVVTYQWQAVDPKMRRYHYVEDQVTKPRSHIGGRIGAGNPDRDRLMCHTGISSIYNRGVYNVGDPIVDGLERTVVNGLGLEQTTKFGYGSTAGSLLDRHDGCPFAMQSVYENDPNKWRPVSVAAGQDSDAFDHRTFLIHSPRSGFDYPEVHVPLVIHDDDEWEQTLEFSIDDGATWTSIEDSGLSAAFPRSLHTGRKAHYFWVRLKHDPETLGGQASQTKRISVSADFPKAPLLSGTSAYFRSYRVWFTSPAASNRHTFRGHQFTSSFGSVTVSRTPVQVEINVGANVTGNVTFQVDARDLYERSDNEISTETPPKTVRTDSFDFYRRLGSCVGCQRLLGDLPDPVVERVGDLSFANLSDTGIDLSWPRVVGAEGYEARWWSTTSPFSGVPAEDAWFGAEPTDPAWGIRHLEPDTEYRAVVYYQDHGATQLSTASPVIRFTTLAAGAPVQVDPASVVVERVPEASISAAPGTITEGDDAVFTVTLDPAPDAPLDVRVHVTAPSAGSVVDGQHVGERTVNVPTAGSASFTIPTVYDPSPTSNGMLGATVDFGEGYRLSKFNSYASVYVANNDLPPPPPVQLKAVSDTTATVAWKPQGDGTTYRVAWHKAYSGIPVMTEVTTTATEYQLTGLDPRSNYTVSVLVGSRQIGKLSVKTLAAGATPKTFTVDFDPPSTELPVISVTADGDVTEGEDATFTVTANPAPAADLDVSVTVSQSGDYGAITGHTEQRTVTIPAAGYVTLTVATANDEADEADGSVTVTVDAGASLDYRVSSSQGTAVVVVADDDGDHTVNQGTIARVKELASQTQHGTAHVNRWNRVLLAFGEHDGTDVTGGPMTASEAQDMADRHSSNVWDLVVVELTALEAATAPTPPPPTPEVSVTAGSGITEGGDATFTVTASPAPAADLAVSVTVSQSGDYGAATGQRTVTVPTTGSVTVTVGTTDDSTDETDGSVTATANAGSGYTVSASQGAATVDVADDDAPTPVVSVAGASGGTEGDPVAFTLSASPAPAADLAVSVTVATTGDFGYGALPASVTIPASGSATVTVATTGDDTDEPDGTVTLTVNAGSGYTVGALSSQTADVADDDDPAGYTVDPDVIAKVQALAAQTQHGTAHVNRWNRALVAFGEHDGIGVTGGPMTAADAQQMADTHSSPVWDEVAAELAALETAALQTAALQPPPPPPTPEVSITAGSGVAEGGDATFTVSASPAPTASLDVSVTVSQSGDYGAATGRRTVTVPATGSVTVSVGTSDDTTDEADGSVTATVDAGSGYTVSATQSAATVAVADDDPPVVMPVVSIAAGSGVAEGGAASFTLTASPAPAADLDVTVTIAAAGDYGVTAGSRTVTIPASGSVTLTIATVGDQTDEPDGSVTATLVDGTAYDLGSSKTATVSVADDDDPPVVVPVVSIAAGSGVTEGGAATFTLSVGPAPASPTDVTVTVTASGDWGANIGPRTVRIAPGQTSATLTVATADDSADEPDGSVTATIDSGSGYTGSGSAAVAVADNDDPPTVDPDQPDVPDQVPLAACAGRPTLLISSPTASRSDASVDFEVSLSCIPASSPIVLLSPVRDGRIGQNLFINLSAEQTTATVPVTIGNEHQLGLAVVWSSGLANRYAQGDVAYTD